MARREARVVEAERAGPRRGELVEQRVGAGETIVERGQPPGRVEIEDDAFLAAVPVGEGRGAARGVAARTLDLQHIGTEFGQHQPGDLDRHALPDLDDAKVAQHPRQALKLGRTQPSWIGVQSTLTFIPIWTCSASQPETFALRRVPGAPSRSTTTGT